MKNFIQNILEGKTLNLAEVAKEMRSEVANFKMVYFTKPLAPRDRIGSNEKTAYFGTQAEVDAFVLKVFPDGVFSRYRNYTVTEVFGIVMERSDYKGDYSRIVLESVEGFRNVVLDYVVWVLNPSIGCKYPTESISIKFDTDIIVAVEPQPEESTETDIEPQQKDRSDLFFVEFIRNQGFVPSDGYGCFYFDTEDERKDALLDLNGMYAEYDRKTTFKDDDLWLEIFGFPRSDV